MSPEQIQGLPADHVMPIVFINQYNCFRYNADIAPKAIGFRPMQLDYYGCTIGIIITSANVDNKRGHGLGYLIIKYLIKTMEAVLTIESEKGGGTTVSVKLPATKNSEG